MFDGLQYLARKVSTSEHEVQRSKLDSEGKCQTTRKELEQILDFTPLALIYADSERRIARVNPAFESQFGYSADEVIGKPTEIIYAEYEDFLEQGKTRFNLNASCKRKPYQVEYRRKDGTTFIGETVGSAVKCEEGTTIAFLGLVQDVTERAAAERLILQAKSEAEESEKRFRMLADSATPLCWITELDSSCSWLNKRWVDYTGKSLSQQTGQKWLESVHPADRQRVFDSYERAFSNQEEFSLDYRLQSRDGRYRWFTANAAPRFDDLGSFLGYVGMSFDTHEIRENRIALEHSKAELEETNKRLTKSNAELEQFAHVASHDLQEPLRKLSTFCELLDEEYGDVLSGDGDVYLGYIKDGAQRMRSLIRGILEFSRIDSLEHPRGLFDAGEAFDAVLENINTENSKITRGDLPQISVGRSVFERVLANFIGNGLKYCETDPEVHVDCNAEDGEYVFSVKDNGIGIAPEYHQKIFGLFKRLHNRSSYEGSGIGLAICERIVRHWGGRIWVESDGQSGSTFLFSCPIPEFRGEQESVQMALAGFEPADTKV